MFKRLRQRRRLQRMIQREVLETLCTICLYLDYEGIYSRNRYAQAMRMHFQQLKELSQSLKEEGGSDGTER